MSMPMAEWTPEIQDKVAALWKEGKSATEIATELGGEISRNAVLGRIYRMGLARNGAKQVPPSYKSEHQKKYDERRWKPEDPSPVTKYPVNEIWNLEENERRKAFAARAAKGARQTLKELGNG